MFQELSTRQKIVSAKPNKPSNGNSFRVQSGRFHFGTVRIDCKVRYRSDVLQNWLNTLPSTSRMKQEQFWSDLLVRDMDKAESCWRTMQENAEHSAESAAADSVQKLERKSADKKYEDWSPCSRRSEEEMPQKTCGSWWQAYRNWKQEQPSSRASTWQEGWNSCRSTSNRWDEHVDEKRSCGPAEQERLAFEKV